MKKATYEMKAFNHDIAENPINIKCKEWTVDLPNIKTKVRKQTFVKTLKKSITINTLW